MGFKEVGVKFVAEGLGAFKGALAEGNQAVRGFAQGATAGVGGFAATATKSLGAVGFAAIGMGAAGAAGFVALAKASTDKAADLEAQMSGIAAIMGETKEAVTPLREEILRLGMDPKLKVSAVEAANAIEMLARNGLKMTDILGGAAEATVLLSNSTGGDFAQSADIATDVMALFNIESRDMMQAVDGITSVVTNSKFSVQDYALALAQGGGVAASVGVEFNDFNTAIAGIAPLFASGSDAGTSFKTFLQRLVPATGPASEAMAELGILAEDGSNAFFDANGQMKDMAEIAGILNAAMQDLSEEDRNRLFSKAFGTDAMRAAFGLAQVGEAGFKKLQKQMAQTSAVDAAATRMDNLKGSMEILSGIVETLQIRIGEALIPIIRQMTDAAGTFLAANADRIAGFFEQAAATIPALVASLTEFVAGLGQMTIAGQPLVTLLADNLQPILIALAGVITAGVLVAVGSLIASLIGAAAPILALVAVVAVLVKAWQSNWGDIQGKTAAVWGFLQPILASLASWLGENIPKAIAVVKTFWETVLSPALQALWTFISGTLIPILSNLVSWLQEKTAAAFGVVKNAWDTILQPALQALWGFLDKDLIPLIKALIEVQEAVRDKGAEAIRGAWEKILKPALSALWGFVNEKLNPVIGSTTGALSGINDFIRDTLAPGLQWFIDDRLGRWRKAFDDVRRAISGVIDFLKDLAERIRNLDLPDWLKPGSPTPFELGLWGINRALRETNRLLNVSPFSGPWGRVVTPPMSAAQIAGRGAVTNTSSVTNHWSLTAQYPYQSQRTLVQDIRALQMLSPSA